MTTDAEWDDRMAALDDADSWRGSGRLRPAGDLPPSLSQTLDAEGWAARIRGGLADGTLRVADSAERTYGCRCENGDGWIVVDAGGPDGQPTVIPCSSCRPALLDRWEADAELDGVLGPRTHLDHSRPASGCGECQSIVRAHRPGDA